MKKIFVLDDDPDALQVLKLALEAEGYQVLTASDSRQGLHQIGAEHPDLLILDLIMPGLDGLEVCRQLRQVPQTEKLPIIMLSARGEVADRVKALKVGADDYISKPTELSEIIARVQTLLALEDTRFLNQGRIAVCIGAKGGVGTTVLAVNLATALAMNAEGSTVLVDACFQFGGVQTALNIRSSNNLSDLLPYASHLESEIVNKVLAPHQSGLEVLLAPSKLEEMEVIQPAHLKGILTKLQEMFDYVVVDAWPFLNSLTLAVLDQAHTILLILTPEVSSLHRARLWLNVAEERGYAPSRVHLVLGQDRGQAGFSHEEIARLLGYPLLCSFPYEPRLVSRALNRGVPLMLGSNGGPLKQGFWRLAQWIGHSESLPAELSAARSQGVLDGLLKSVGRA